MKLLDAFGRELPQRVAGFVLRVGNLEIPVEVREGHEGFTLEPAPKSREHETSTTLPPRTMTKR
jgi:hypothetical protein